MEQVEVKQTKNYSGWFYIVAGLVYISSLNLMLIIVGLIFIFNGICVIKQVSLAKRKIVTWTSFILLAIIIFLNVLSLLMSGFSQMKLIAVLFSLIIITTLFREFRAVSSEQDQVQLEKYKALNESMEKTFSNPRSIFYIALLIIIVAIFAYFATGYIEHFGDIKETPLPMPVINR